MSRVCIRDCAIPDSINNITCVALPSRETKYLIITVFGHLWQISRFKVLTSPCFAFLMSARVSLCFEGRSQPAITPRFSGDLRFRGSAFPYIGDYVHSYGYKLNRRWTHGFGCQSIALFHPSGPFWRMDGRSPGEGCMLRGRWQGGGEFAVYFFALCKKKSRPDRAKSLVEPSVRPTSAPLQPWSQHSKGNNNTHTHTHTHTQVHIQVHICVYNLYGFSCDLYFFFFYIREHIFLLWVLVSSVCLYRLVFNVLIIFNMKNGQNRILKDLIA